MTGQFATEYSGHHQRNNHTYLSKNKFNNLKEIIAGDPNKLHSHIQAINTLIAAGKVEKFYTLNNNGQPVSTDFGTSILELFGYSSFRKAAPFFNIYAELSRLHCTYCNLDTNIIITTTTGKKKALFDLDHYFSKVKYPYLSVSLQNLIPSCTNCNGRIKGVQDLVLGTHAHPFLDDIHSSISFSTSNPLLQGTPYNIVLEQKGRDNVTYQKALNLLNFLEITRRYEPYKQEANRLYDISQRYPLSKKKELLEEVKIFKPHATEQDAINTLCIEKSIPTSEDNAANMFMGKFKLDFADKFDINRWA